MSEKLTTLRTAGKERVETRESWKKKLFKAAGRVLTYGTLSVLAWNVASVEIRHAKTRYEVNIEMTGDTRRYMHEDAQTTEIIDFLTGKAHAPESYLLAADRKLVRDMYESYLEPIPNNVWEMSREEAHASLRALSAELNARGLANNIEESIQLGYEEIPYDPALAQAFWEVFRENGAPRIRFITDRNDPIVQNMQSFIGTQRAFYDANTNTMYLEPGSIRSSLLAELAHGGQFDEAPLRSRLLFWLSKVQQRIDQVIHEETDIEAYDRTYERRGSLEERAHGSSGNSFKPTENDGEEGKIARRLEELARSFGYTGSEQPSDSSQQEGGE